MPKVVVVGDTDADFYYLVDHIPTWDEGVLVTECFYKPGGKGANTASVLSTLGIDTGILSVIGNDENGKRSLLELEKNRVNTDGMIIADGYETYHCIVMLDKTGEKAYLVRTTEIVYPLPEHLIQKEKFLCSAKHAHFIGINPSRMLPSIKVAKEHGITVSVDLDAAYPGLDECREVIENSDIVLLNRQGAMGFFPSMDLKEMVHGLLALGPSNVIITLGSDGAVAGNIIGEYYEFPAYKVDVVDTAGSGDTFSGAIVYCVLNNMNLQDSLEFATAAAAISIGEIGAQGAMPTSDAVQQFIEKRRGNNEH